MDDAMPHFPMRFTFWFKCNYTIKGFEKMNENFNILKA